MRKKPRKNESTMGAIFDRVSLIGSSCIVTSFFRAFISLTDSAGSIYCNMKAASAPYFLVPVAFAMWVFIAT